MKAPTLLAEACLPDGTIDPPGVERVVAAVDHTVRAAHRLCVDQLYVLVTVAVRDAVNSEPILDRLERGTGVRPRSPTGEDEACWR